MQEILNYRIRYAADALWRVQKGQGFLWMPVFFALGVMLYFALDAEPAPVLGLGGALGGGLGALALLIGYWGRPFVRKCALFLLMFAMGFTAAQVRSSLVYTPILAKKMQPVEVSGRIDMVEHLEGGRGVRLMLVDVEIEDLSPAQTPRKVRVTMRGEGDFRSGQRVSLLGGLSPPSPPVMPGGFDFQRYMYFKGIGASGFAFGTAEVIDETGRANFFAHLRSGVNEKVIRALETDEESGAGALASALMTGMRSGMRESDIEAMRGAGLAHMLAISGLHVGLFSGVVFFFVRLVLACFPALALQYPIKKYAAFCAMAAAVFYMFMGGASIPTQRAVVMSLVFFLAIILDRTPLSMRLVAFAALCVLAVSPESLLGVSFQLSFAAVAALVAFYEWSAGFWRKAYGQQGVLRRAGLYVAGVCATTVIATLATAPFSLYHFQQLATYSLAGNLLAMPILSFIVMPMAVLSYVLMPLGLEAWPLQLMGLGCAWILRIAHGVSELEGAIWHVSQWPLPVLLSFATAFIILMLVRGRGRGKLLAVAPFALSLYFIMSTSLPFLLVSDNAKLVAYYEQEAERLSFNALNKEYFVRDVWLRSYGLSEGAAEKWPREGEGPDGHVRCGGAGCRIEHEAHVIDVLSRAQGVDASCAGGADFIIVQEPVEGRCDSVQIIDLFDVFDHGAYGLYMDGDRVRVRRVNDERGARPWNAQAQRRAD